MEAPKTEIPMRNVGLMTKASINAIIAQLPSTKVTVEKGDIYIEVKVVKTGQQILTAARIRGSQWHVRAREGLITATYR